MRKGEKRGADTVAGAQRVTEARGGMHNRIDSWFQVRGVCGLKYRRYHFCPVWNLSSVPAQRSPLPIKPSRAETVVVDGENQGKTEEEIEECARRPREMAQREQQTPIKQ